MPRPVVQHPLRPENLRRLNPGSAAVGAPAGRSEYASGDRVVHATFGSGTVVRVEMMTTDHKLVVAFDGSGEKTLLEKFAKLTKL